MHRCRYRLYQGTIAKRTIPLYPERESTFTLHTSSLPCVVYHRAATTREHNPTVSSISKPHDKCAKVIESGRPVPSVCIRYVFDMYVCICMYAYVHMYMLGLRHAIVSIELLARNVDVSSGNVGIYFFVAFATVHLNSPHLNR